MLAGKAGISSAIAAGGETVVHAQSNMRKSVRMLRQSVEQAHAE